MLLRKIKSLIQQMLLRHKFAKTNIIERNVVFSKNTIIDGGSFIGENSIIGHDVELHKNARIGKNARLSNIIVGENSVIESEVICTGYGNGRIKIGKESYIGIRNILDWSDNITIGNYVHIAGLTTALWTHSSVGMCLNSIPLSQKDDKKYRSTAEINIEDNVYIGGNCTIYPGVTIQHHSVIVSHSVVNKDIPPYTMAGGVPAKVIKKIDK